MGIKLGTKKLDLEGKPIIVSPVKERDVMEMCKNYLDILQDRKYLTYIRNNTVSGKIVGGGYIQNAQKGSPDLLIFLSNGQTLHVELKRPGGIQDPDQIEWQEKIEKLGYSYYVVDNVDQLVKVIGKHRALTMKS